MLEKLFSSVNDLNTMVDLSGVYTMWSENPQCVCGENGIMLSPAPLAAMLKAKVV